MMDTEWATGVLSNGLIAASVLFDPDGARPVGHKVSHTHWGAGTGKPATTRRQHFFAVAEGEHMGIRESYAEVKL